MRSQSYRRTARAATNPAKARILGHGGYSLPNHRAELSERVLHWPSMRIWAVIVVTIFSIFCVGCTSEGVMLQPPVQGEWSNFHNDKNQVSKDAREPAEKAPAEK
jgi:hypothetical protein